MLQYKCPLELFDSQLLWWILGANTLWLSRFEVETKWLPFCWWHFWIYFYKDCYILIRIVLKFVAKGPVNNIPILVQMIVHARFTPNSQVPNSQGTWDWVTTKKIAKLAVTRGLVGKVICSSYVTHQKVLSYSWMFAIPRANSRSQTLM